VKNSLIKNKSASILKALAILSVLAAYVFGLLKEEKNYQEKLIQAFPDMTIISSTGNDPVCYYANFPEGTKYVLLYKTMGWGGPALIATKVDTSGFVEKVSVVDHKETPSFFAQLIKKSFFDQYKGKHISDGFILDEDINAVSGATISSEGFNTALRKSYHYLGNTKFKMDIPEITKSISFNGLGYLILLLFILAYLGSRFGFSRFLMVIQLIAVVVIGFMLNYPLSVSHITSLFMGFFPSPVSNITWYILLGSIVVMILFVGKNLYCTWICPFGAIQDLMHKISGISLPIPQWLKKYGKNISGIIAWFSVCVIFISRNPAIGNFEPFAALFSFKGFGIIWIVLPVLIFSSFFIKRMWCRFFCPVGFLLNNACKLRNSAKKKINSNNEKGKIEICGKCHDNCA
jgi:Na+-translocating ferredoxin:NAD+ oxidoreductase RnfG subunit